MEKSLWWPKTDISEAIPPLNWYRDSMKLNQNLHNFIMEIDKLILKFSGTAKDINTQNNLRKGK